MAMSKTFILISLLFLLVVTEGYCVETRGKQPAVFSDISVNFRIPENWKKINDNLFILKDFNETFTQWNKILSKGHQPWRLEPINIAAACLWDFGIKDNSDDIFKFADRLTEIKENKLFMLKDGKNKYLIYVRVKKTIPIAYKLVITGN
jgi:hypothetical protein